MQRIRYTTLGGPEVLQLEQAPSPALSQSDDVKIRLAYASVNHTDIHFRRGLPGVSSPLPHTPGCDGAGTILEVGKHVRHFAVGDRVYMDPGYGCGECEFCLQDQKSLCRKHALIGRETDGTYAQEIVLPAKQLRKVPESLDLSIAAAAPLVYQTAWRMVVTQGHVQPAQTVLVMGAGSGVGMAAIQIAHHFGAKVFTTASSADKIQKAKDILPVQDVIAYRDTPINHAIKDLTQKRGVDLIIDHVGGRQWIPLLKSLRNGGTLVTCGATDGYTPDEDLRHIFFRQLQIKGSTMGTDQELADVMALVGRSVLVPVIDRIFPLKDAAKAHAYVESRQVFGKVLLDLA
jgi:NADPH:quinone reductase-like Zn-dependent oxidoreductase